MLVRPTEATSLWRERERERERDGDGGGELNAPQIVAKGPGAAEKVAIHKKLVDYRQRNGLGCFARVATVTNGALTDDDIRDMYNGVSVPLVRWKVLGAALAHCEKTEENK